jgi:alcohol dehydrogenase, propanol-preferring
MRAFRLLSPGRTDLASTPDPEPQAGEVRVKVGAAGVCHSDLHIIDAPEGAGFPLPLTLGHENAGWVDATGPGVVGWTRGDPVAVYGILGCGRCYACLRGRDNECRRIPPGGIGITREGGMAEYLVVPAGQLLPIADLDVSQAATLTDAGLTSYHAIELCRDSLRQGATAVVIGVGGLGHMAIQILAATTPARIIAVDRSEDALSLAQQLGAHQAIRSDDDTVAAIRSMVGPPPGGAEVVFDFVAVDQTLAIAAAVVSTGGWLSLVGLGGGSLTIRPGAGGIGIPMETRVMIPFWGTRAELADVIALASAGRIRAHVEPFPLANVAEAYNRLRAGRLSGRGVILPHGDPRTAATGGS